MLHTTFRMRQEQFLFCTSNTHITKSAFFFDVLFTAIHHRTETGEHPLFHTDDEYIGEFQTFCTMQCHQGHRFFPFFVIINIRNQSHFFQEAFQIAFRIIFLIFRSLIHKFVDILDTVQGFICTFFHQKLQIACAFYDSIDQCCYRKVGCI